MLKRTVVLAGLLLAAALLFPVSVSAWPACSGNWVQVPSGTSSAGGAIYATGDGLTFQCQTAPATLPASNPTSTSTSTSTSGATSTATSGAAATGTGGNATGGNSNATGGNATGGNAAGGNSSSSSGVSNSGNSSSSSGVSNSGNSHNSNTNTSTATGGTGGSVSGSGNSNNTNTSTATGGAGGQGGAGGAGGAGGQGGSVSGSGNATQGQAQTQTSKSSASNNGNGNGNGSNNTVTNVAASQVPVATAYAPTSLPTVPCFKGMSGGMQTMAVGLSFGGGKVDPGCDSREIARSYALLGSRLAACKVMVQIKRSKDAGVTLADCMAQAPMAVDPASAPATPASPVPQVAVNVPPDRIIGSLVTVPAPPMVEQASAPAAKESARSTVGVCNPDRLPSFCKAVLDEAIRQLKADPDLRLFIVGNQYTVKTADAVKPIDVATAARAQRALSYLGRNGIDSGRIVMAVGNGPAGTVEVLVGAE